MLRMSESMASVAASDNDFDDFSSKVGFHDYVEIY